MAFTKYMLSRHSSAQEIKHLWKFTSSFIKPQILNFERSLILSPGPWSSLVPHCFISFGGPGESYYHYYTTIKTEDGWYKGAIDALFFESQGIALFLWELMLSMILLFLCLCLYNCCFYIRIFRLLATYMTSVLPFASIWDPYC